MSPRFVLGRENVPCIAEVVLNRSLKADRTTLALMSEHMYFWPTEISYIWLSDYPYKQVFRF